MKEQPDAVDDTAVRQALRAWDIEAETLAYAPVGFGDHHWTARGPGGAWFVTVSDLENKEHCGVGPEAAWRGLDRAMETAAALGDRPGFGFVVAPLRTAAGETLRRLPDGRHAIAVFPHREGTAGEFGQRPAAAARTRTLETLAELHRAAPPAAVPVLSTELSARARLARDLRETAAPWHGGPFAEPARALLAGSALDAALGRFDRLADRVRRTGGDLVVTHGEPHPGNLLWQGERLLLVDWDTVGLAPPERDLWTVAADDTDLARYAELTGRTPDPDALALYRLRWDLEDVTAFLGWFRAPHDRDADTEQAWRGFTDIVDRLAVV